MESVRQRTGRVRIIADIGANHRLAGPKRRQPPLYRLPLFARPFWVGTRACAADADTRSAPQRADTLPMVSPCSGSSGRIHAKRHSPEKLMNDLTRKARGTPQQHRKYAQDTATDDGMPIAPEKPRLTNPNAREQPRTAEQKRSDASPRPGTACRSTR